MGLHRSEHKLRVELLYHDGSRGPKLEPFATLWADDGLHLEVHYHNYAITVPRDALMPLVASEIRNLKIAYYEQCSDDDLIDSLGQP